MRSIAVAAVLLAGIGAAPVLAQPVDINSLIAGIGGSEFLDAADRASSAGDLRVVRLSTFSGAENETYRLDSVLELKSRDMDFLHSNLAINPMARMAIRNSGFGVEDIVALSRSGDGAIILYADDI